MGAKIIDIMGRWEPALRRAVMTCSHRNPSVLPVDMRIGFLWTTWAGLGGSWWRFGGALHALALAQRPDMEISTTYFAAYHVLADQIEELSFDRAHRDEEPAAFPDPQMSILSVNGERVDGYELISQRCDSATSTWTRADEEEAVERWHQSQWEARRGQPLTPMSKRVCREFWEWEMGPRIAREHLIKSFGGVNEDLAHAPQEHQQPNLAQGASGGR